MGSILELETFLLLCREGNSILYIEPKNRATEQRRNAKPMSAAALGHHAETFYASTVGKKAVMAISGCALFLFVAGAPGG